MRVDWRVADSGLTTLSLHVRTNRRTTVPFSDLGDMQTIECVPDFCSCSCCFTYFCRQSQRISGINACVCFAFSFSFSFSRMKWFHRVIKSRAEQIMEPSLRATPTTTQVQVLHELSTSWDAIWAHGRNVHQCTLRARDSSPDGGFRFSRRQ